MSGENKSFKINGLYLIIAIITCLAVAIFGDSKSINSPLGFFTRMFMFIAGVPFGYLGMTVGKAIRNAIVPDFIMSASTGGLIKARIFWAIGPQAIGLLVGMCIALYIVFKIAGVNFR
jgi:hypothetical protein